MNERADDELVIPVVEEQVRVGKRVVSTGQVRVHQSVEERTERIEADLLRETVHIERVPINRQVEAAPEIREEGDVLIYPVVEEIVVVERRLVLKEELRITRVRDTERFSEDVTLRRAQVSVERSPTGG